MGTGALCGDVSERAQVWTPPLIGRPQPKHHRSNKHVKPDKHNTDKSKAGDTNSSKSDSKSKHRSSKGSGEQAYIRELNWKVGKLVDKPPLRIKLPKATSDPTALPASHSAGC